MNHYKAKAHVTLKREVLDPQGDAIRRALHALGHEGVGKVRVGKFIELDVTADSAEAASEELHAMCKKLLSNPVVEDFELEVEKTSA